MPTKNLTKVKEEVLKRVIPDSKEVQKAQKLADDIKTKVEEKAKKHKLDCEVRIDGSFAKDTWLKGEADIDLFMRVPKTLTEEEFRKVCLKVAKESVKEYGHIERYAEHPYIETVIDSYKVNIVPCYLTEKNKWISAVDRTPFHTDYMKEKLGKLREEVRILKKFMKGIKTYGAEIKVGGFSGMLCETLILNYGSFEDTIKSAINWKKREIIDIENHYEATRADIYDLFDAPFIVIDPVDKFRNVAAAVREQKLWDFVYACRVFLRKPSLDFFYPTEPRLLSKNEMCRKITEYGSNYLALKFGEVDAVVDVLWSQLYKSERCLKNLFKKNDFNVFRSGSWSNEADLNIIIFELEENPISSVKKHFGPHIYRRKNGDIFINKHLKADDTILGPWIENDRLVVEKKRKYCDAADLLNESLSKGGENIGIGKLVIISLQNGFDILLDKDILNLYNLKTEFSKFLVDFLNGKPIWME
jgi:tRNA nucleotidyltransferase (CCA-adding enzyme)